MWRNGILTWLEIVVSLKPWVFYYELMTELIFPRTILIQFNFWMLIQDCVFISSTLYLIAFGPAVRPVEILFKWGQGTNIHWASINFRLHTCYYPHFIYGETEAKEDSFGCPRSSPVNLNPGGLTPKLRWFPLHIVSRPCCLVGTLFTLRATSTADWIGMCFMLSFK